MADVLPGIFSWVQTVGGFAMIGVLIWLVADWRRRKPAARDAVPAWMRGFMMVCIVLALIAYALTLPLRLFEMYEFCFGSYLYPSPNGGAVDVIWKPVVVVPPNWRWLTFGQTVVPGVPFYEAWCLFIGGLLSLAVVLTPFLRNVVALRWRRIFALAGLSYKEALRRRVLWAFSALLLVFLFGSWFISGRAKHEDQLRTYVQLVFWAMTPLLLFTSVLLAAFSIPADIRQQTIHTVLTKPVQRFEVYLGRVLGLAGLMSLVLLVLSGVSLLYVLHGVDADAAAESLKARAPLFGALSFENTDDPKLGVSVGDEWSYRSYISAPIGGEPPQTAVFHFTDLPGSFAQPNHKPIRCEFTFAIYRAYKGEKEGRGIGCDFVFQTWRFDPAKLDEYRKERKTEINKGRAEADVDDALAEKYGYFEVNNYPVKNFHTMTRDLPAGLFRNAEQDDKAWRKSLNDQRKAVPDPLEVRVRCLDKQEYVGMARYDMYLRQDDPDAGGDARGFAVNFLKGAAGLWMRLVLVIGVATAL
ncbi:MAG TPA: ABC transporter permease, partial [Gemmataceae bacterium]|nr:ABC transporter permease [Gemmataceae bacterium]